MAVRYYIYSINFCKYRSELCNDTRKNCRFTKDGDKYPRMGYHADKTDEKYRNSSNTFYTNTTFKMPFCRDINSHMIKKVESYNTKYSKLSTI